MKSQTNWAKIDAMTDEELTAAALSDPDIQPWTDADFKKCKLVYVYTPKTVDVKMIRTKLKLSQEQFARYFGVSIRTIQEWEQYRRTPTATARNFLKVIEKAPLVVQKALADV